jgi:hypothetical protein
MHVVHGSISQNKPPRTTAKTGVSGKYASLIPPETPPRATRLDGLIPAYALQSSNIFVLFVFFVDELNHPSSKINLGLT